jgi:hypothetical protein
VIYVNFDLETTGGAPDRHAILNIGAVAHDSEGWGQVDLFNYNLKVPENRVWDPETKAWWETDPEAIKAWPLITSSPWSAEWVCKLFMEWLLDLPRHPNVRTKDTRISFVANPIAFDFPFLRSYMTEYVGRKWIDWASENRAGFGGVDLPTLAMAVIGAETREDIRPYPDCRRRLWPERWNPQDRPYTHVALEDAMHQAFAFVRMMNELEEIRGRRPW